MSKAETSKEIFLIGVWRTSHSAKPLHLQPGCGHLKFANFLLTGTVWPGCRPRHFAKAALILLSLKPKSRKAPVQIAHD